VSNLFRRRRTRKDGTVYLEKRWRVRFRDATGKMREELAYAEKGKSHDLLRKRQAAAREGRVEYGGQFRRLVERPLWSDVPGVGSHVGDYLAHLDAKGTGAGQRERVKGHLVNAFSQMRVTRFPELTQTHVERNLVDLMAAGRSAATRNHRLSALRSFWRWGVATKPPRFPQNNDPTTGLIAMNAEAHRVRPRRDLTIEELRALVKAGRERPLANYVATHPQASQAKRESLAALGLQRATLYTLAAFAGLRRNELRELRWGDVRLDAERPHLVVRAASAKAKREEVVELAPDAVEALREWQASETRRRWAAVSGTARVFDCVGHGLLKALWADCAFARVAVVGHDGRMEQRPIQVTTQDGRVDVHALRHTTATLLCAAGVPVHIAQRLMRHRDPRTTLRVYAHVGDAARAEAVKSLPRLSLQQEPARQAEGAGG
jgi:integrase